LTQPLHFWPFVWQCVLRALDATLHLPGWNVRTIIITAVLLVLGFLFHLFKKGASETKKKITDHMLLKVAPAVIFVVAVFGYFLCKAPYDIYSEEHGRNRLLNGLPTWKRKEIDLGQTKRNSRLTWMLRGKLIEQSRGESAKTTPLPTAWLRLRMRKGDAGSATTLDLRTPL